MGKNGDAGPIDLPFCLPAEYAAHNLLDGVRPAALELFGELEIPWHAGVGEGPSNHLVSSQVQCVNALGQMMDDPDRIVRAFGSALDIASVRDFGEIDPSEAGRYLTFEFIGEHDYLNEARDGKRIRGSQCTSVDAAFAYRTSSGVDGLALVEWKFTEAYPSPGTRGGAKEATRLRRYTTGLSAPDGPLLLDGVNIADLFHEPLYQLARQQLLARELERDARVKADVVRVVHVLSPQNLAYQRSFIAPALRERGATVSEVWQTLLRNPEAFVSYDPVGFLDPVVTSEEYCLRYGSVNA